MKFLAIYSDGTTMFTTADTIRDAIDDFEARYLVWEDIISITRVPEEEQS